MSFLSPRVRRVYLKGKYYKFSLFDKKHSWLQKPKDKFTLHWYQEEELGLILIIENYIFKGLSHKSVFSEVTCISPLSFYLVA